MIKYSKQGDFMKKKITENTTLAEILENEKAQEILEEFAVPCLICPMMSMEASAVKIGDICDTYGIDKSKLLEKLNNINE